MMQSTEQQLTLLLEVMNVIVSVFVFSCFFDLVCLTSLEKSAFLDANSIPPPHISTNDMDLLYSHAKFVRAQALFPKNGKNLMFNLSVCS